MNTPGMHCGSLATSPPLKFLYFYLRQHTHEYRTTRQIGEDCELEATSTWISMLNKCLDGRGERVEHKYLGRTPNGRQLHGYKLVIEERQEEQPPPPEAA